VSDIEAVIAHARRQGIDTSQTSSVPMVKTLMITDPTETTLLNGRSSHANRRQGGDRAR
jgi:hypothetical protein